MVFYFTSTAVDPPVTLFMGMDKFENEHLIKWGWPEDVWFHVDKVSSAHVYLRLNPGESLDSVPQTLIEDAAQLVKANSIEGCKMNDVDVVYTMWENLHKTESMEVGQIGFHKQKEVRKIRLPKKDTNIINRLNKTKVEKEVDFRGEREQRDKEEREDKKKKMKKIEEQKKEEEKKRKEEAELRSYSNLMKEEKMKSNKDGGSDSDDFM
ncbi:coiled-coil domain-containing protein 25 isoform X1 [Eurytemora carolleeae]|uniref:coiled-coil domain-containing protein 25 isoform X1 n=1 Tax=Eurytemora carolleeae TaxID=1294199 RepID=UPI000C756491|nr:coiled-coil domain-containing protein 25 isoform X1 [Eurytemora carolleeae]|eukprot:XP_023327206.1 coiled-coil domain-containing protein 25-like isoform X1 [Eurytemora affinis]